MKKIRPWINDKDYWCVNCGETCSRSLDTNDKNFDLAKVWDGDAYFISRDKFETTQETKLYCTQCGYEFNMLFLVVHGKRDIPQYDGPFYYPLSYEIETEAPYAFINTNYEKETNRNFMACYDGDIVC